MTATTRQPLGARGARDRRPPSDPAHAAAISLLRAADLVRRQAVAVVEPHGITIQQFNVLRILRGARSAGGAGLPTLEVGARMIEQTPGVTRLLDRLEAKGLARREQCPDDRRQHLCRITPQGLGVLAALDEPIVAGARESLRGLTTAQQSALLDLLEAVRSAHE